MLLAKRGRCRGFGGRPPRADAARPPAGTKTVIAERNEKRRKRRTRARTDLQGRFLFSSSFVSFGSILWPSRPSAPTVLRPLLPPSWAGLPQNISAGMLCFYTTYMRHEASTITARLPAAVRAWPGQAARSGLLTRKDQSETGQLAAEELLSFMQCCSFL